MAKLILNDDEIEVPDGENIVDFIEEAGVPIDVATVFAARVKLKLLKVWTTYLH